MNMNSTALGATAEREGNIIFISDVHEKFYYEKTYSQLVLDTIRKTCEFP